MSKTKREQALDKDIQTATSFLASIGRTICDMRRGKRDSYDTENLQHLQEDCDKALATLDYNPLDYKNLYTYQD